MLFSVSLYVSLAVFLLGLAYKVGTWFTLKIGPEAEGFSAWERLAAGARGLAGTLFSRRFPSLLKPLVLDVLFQRRLLQEDFFRWLIHILIYGGFVLLVLMHALGEVLTQALFPDYAPTLNPFLFLRDLFGALVLVGLGLALYRRAAFKGLRLPSRAGDRYALLILAVIMVSGFLLHGLKIVSASRFQEMVETYSDVEEPEEVQALKAYWARDFGVVFPEGPLSEDPQVLETGFELHEYNCAACHSRPQWAFVSYPLAQAVRPAAQALDKARVDLWLWPLHFLACFLGLAYLPFSKFFHLFSSPVSLLARQVMDPDRTSPANAATRRALELDACTHCGLCSLHCFVGPVFRRMTNLNILPSEKLAAVKTLAARKALPPEQLQAIQEGSFICTSCYRCTQVCPAGINLEGLWSASREDLAAQGFPEPQLWARELGAAEAARLREDPGPLLVKGDPIQRHLRLSSQAETFSVCFNCRTCTIACPVVRQYENPAQALDLVPHQIMHALALGLREWALGTRMIWDCLTCYLCQEHCPQGVRVCDVFYELKNLAYDWRKEAELEKRPGRTAEARPGGPAEGDGS